ncbi:MAG: SDR family oxidoreductase [Actinomycetota bacterium]
MAAPLAQASFDVVVEADQPTAFARLSGDWNPLHTDAEYARGTPYGRPVLHGAFAAGLVSRMAGMHLPGRACLLHGIRLRFVAPVLPPVTLRVFARQVSGGEQAGTVEVSITDAADGRQYVQASYDFGLHETTAVDAPVAPRATTTGDGPAVLVTGATGALGSALLGMLGGRGIGLSRSGGDGLLSASDPEGLEAALAGRRVEAVVHAGWPMPDNMRLTKLSDPAAAVGHHVAAPLTEMIELAQLVSRVGAPGACLVLIGSTFAEPGRHGFRTPLYGLAKSMIPTLARILALELGAADKRCAALVFDVLAGGMNKSMGAAQRQMHADRSPSGELATPEDAARQVMWLLDNRSTLVSGATITVSGGALP